MFRKWKIVFILLLLLELPMLRFPLLPEDVPSCCTDLNSGDTVLEIPVDNTVRRYSWFQTFSSCSRRYAFVARLPELPSEMEMLEEGIASGDVIMYHRWLMEIEERKLYDMRYRDIFPNASEGDSVWIRRAVDD